MQVNKSWKTYNDEWNFDNFQLDQRNKSKFISQYNVNNIDSAEQIEIEPSNDNEK